MQVFNNDNLVGIPEALRQCERKCLNVSLELELRASLDDRHVVALQQAIQANGQITTVKFNLHGEWEEISSANRQIVADLVTTIAPLPNLKELTIAGDFAPIPAITDLLYRASNLQSIALKRFRNLKSCDTTHLLAFSQALQRHRSLQCLAFRPRLESRCEPQEETLMQMLLEALAESPALKCVKITTNAPSLSGPALVKLCNSTTLLKLELRPKQEVGIDGLQALARNTKIENLVVCIALEERSCSVLTAMIRNNTTLTSLTLVFSVDDNSMIEEEDHLQTLSDALKTNTTLTYLRLSKSGPLSSSYPSMIPVMESFADMLRTNYTLETVELFDDLMTKVQRISYKEIEDLKDETVKTILLLGKKILYYTLLNRSGRGDLLSKKETVGRKAWVDKLVEFSYCNDRLYFFLRANPTLCSTEETSVPMEDSEDDQQMAARKRCSYHMETE